MHLHGPSPPIPSPRSYQDGKEAPPKPNSKAVKVDIFPVCEQPGTADSRTRHAQVAAGAFCMAEEAAAGEAARLSKLPAPAPALSVCRDRPRGRLRHLADAEEVSREEGAALPSSPVLAACSVAIAPCPSAHPLSAPPHPPAHSFMRHARKLARWLEEDNAEFGETWAVFRCVFS